MHIGKSAGPCLSGAYGCGDGEVVCCLAVAVLQLQSVVCLLWAPETDKSPYRFARRGIPGLAQTQQKATG